MRLLALAILGAAPAIALFVPTVHAATLHVHIQGFAFSPGSVSVDVGDSVEWHNHDSATHSAVSDSGAFDTGLIRFEETRAQGFSAVGTFPYHCGPHGLSMRGTVTVQASPVNLPPSVTVSTPAEGATVSGTVHFAGDATDPEGDAFTLEYEVAGHVGWTAIAGRTPWSFEWDSRRAPDGGYTVHVRAVFAQGEVTRSLGIRVANGAPPAANRAPSVLLLDPAEGAAIAGFVRVNGSASDPDTGDAVDLVELRVLPEDPAWRRVDGTTVWTYTLDTFAFPDGPHVLEARAKDRAGVFSATATRNVRIANAASATTDRPPTVKIDTPSQDAVLDGPVLVSGTAGDPDPGDAVLRVEVRVDGVLEWTSAEGNTTWTFSWETAGLPDGTYTIRARATNRLPSLEASITVEVLHDTGGTGNVPGPAARGTNRPPEIRILAPAPGERLSGLVLVEGVASDPDPGDAVVVGIRIDGGPVVPVEILGTSFGFPWDSTGVEDGDHRLVAEASDGEAALIEASVDVVVANGRGAGTEETPGPPPSFVVLTTVIMAMGWRRRRRSSGVPSTIVPEP